MRSSRNSETLQGAERWCKEVGAPLGDNELDGQVECATLVVREHAEGGAIVFVTRLDGVTILSDCGCAGGPLMKGGR
jgi:hypothetical protein